MENTRIVFITSCFIASRAALAITVKNTGVAPLYKDAYFAIGSIRSKESLRGLLPDASMEVTIDAPLEYSNSGRALSNPVIESDFILDTQTIEYDCNLETSDLQDVQQSDIEEGQRYNLLGEKVSEEYQGWVIMNGKKILIKNK